MKIALFGKTYNPKSREYVQLIVDELEKRKVKIYCYAPFLADLKMDIRLPETISLFNSHNDLAKDIDFLFSIGGDGTILDTVPIVRNCNIPILGINLGRLGFLSSVPKEEIIGALNRLLEGDYLLDKRALLKVDKPPAIFGDLNFALNDLTIYRNNTTSLITIHVWVDDYFLNSYWGDGLIVSTPTGSTAYSMSVGGPIITPGSQNFVIAPIASHNLTVRPIVIPDSSVIRIKIQGREKQFLFTMDSRHTLINMDKELLIRKENFKINLIQMPEKSFFDTIREKLLWGVDNRN